MLTPPDCREFRVPPPPLQLTMTRDAVKILISPNLLRMGHRTRRHHMLRSEDGGAVRSHSPRLGFTLGFD